MPNAARRSRTPNRTPRFPPCVHRSEQGSRPFHGCANPSLIGSRPFHRSANPYPPRVQTLPEVRAPFHPRVQTLPWVREPLPPKGPDPSQGPRTLPRDGPDPSFWDQRDAAGGGASGPDAAQPSAQQRAIGSWAAAAAGPRWDHGRRATATQRRATAGLTGSCSTRRRSQGFWI